ncbi:hypothetical protein [Clostridium kluyveri]|uniref:Hydroxymyristoyl-ACP dehydratase n=2 Tax=Clostridium kluyveri TaxID=1534 RepID=A5N2W2_CLOK5|nr:hypothetical protein [Clostridium kluyveri]EDK35458.1 Conserved hypothetical protein [Clostridium kluyveri DSM 555]UZQ49071.1 hydroxymyristoyl-ACP dehydratase [Clostridium kluyveri]
MMDINCSENCVHEKNGKCTLNYVTPITSLSSLETNCIYFTPKKKSNNESTHL